MRFTDSVNACQRRSDGRAAPYQTGDALRHCKVHCNEGTTGPVGLSPAEEEQPVIIILYAIVGTLAALASLYFAWRSRDFRKFLTGAFFVSSGVLFYLYLADISVPVLGTSIVQTPDVGAFRSAIHFVLFLLCLYFGFIKG
jgi:hypothetical protein